MAKNTHQDSTRMALGRRGSRAPAATGRTPDLEPISRDEWFRAFDENGLAFIYEADQSSTFNKLVSRETAEARAHR